MESMSEGKGLTALYIDQKPQAALKNQMGTFDEVDLQKSCARAQRKYYETVTIVSRSRHIIRQLQTQEKIESPPGFNIAPAENP